MKLFILTGMLVIAASSPLHADPRTDCQTKDPCRVITLTPDEEKALTGQNMIFDTAVAGRQIDMSGFVIYFRNKISTAPMGDVPALSGSKDETPKEKPKK